MSGTSTRRAVRLLAAAALLVACSASSQPPGAPAPASGDGERIQVLALYPGVTATVVAPANIDLHSRVDLILYALPNGNSTAETIGRAPGDGVGWRYDIQHIGAQTRAARRRGLPQAVVVYLEADSKSWPEWRGRLGATRAADRSASLVDQLRGAIGSPPHLAVTLTGHSGGGSFAWSFIDAYETLPPWLERIALLDSNYGFEPQHGDRIAAWLRSNPRNTLVVLAYDDRDVTFEGRKVVSDSGGTWRATQRMVGHLHRSFVLSDDTAGNFLRQHHAQIEILRHTNPENRILHTALVGELNGYLHALLVRRPEYERGAPVLGAGRAYEQWIAGDVVLPPAAAPDIPQRPRAAPAGKAFIEAVAHLPRAEREHAIRRELLAGNIPDFLRELRPVQVTNGKDTIVYEVMPDYLAVGSDRDFVRMPMTPYTAQAFCDAFGFVLPTSRMVDASWKAATLQLEPRPLIRNREAPLTFLEHHQIIERQLAGQQRGAFVAGIKKDVVVSSKLRERANRVAIYGWHYPNGEPIQPVYAGHVDWYVDYSHGIRPVRRMMRVNGAARSVEEILRDASLRELLSDESDVVMHYER